MLGKGRRGMDAPLPSGTVTFLFTDIEGSTRLLREAGSGYSDLLATHRRILRAAFVAHAGREVNTEGDAFFVAFSSAREAVAAAVRAQRGLVEHAWPDGQDVRVRMGINSGQAVPVDGDYVSLAVHKAARVASAAHGGQIVLSDSTAGLVREGLTEGTRLRDLGDHHLKDFPRRLRLYQLDAPDLRSDFPPLRTSVVHDRLPSAEGAFVGRERDVRELGHLLQQDVRLTTLTGPGGIGKTRLALEVAHAVQDDFPGGVVFVSLAAVTDPLLVLSTVAECLGVRREADVPLLEAAAAAIGEQRTLLVLDNFEQVVGAAADLAALLDRSRAAVALVTSRRELRLRTERRYRVTPLGEKSAIDLFAERAASVRPGFALSEANSAAIAEICRRLDGLPLAIELAAARVRLLSPSALLARLADQLDVVGGGPVDMPVRHRTLRAATDWSHDLLDRHERAVFARLSVFAGGCTVGAAEAVCGREGEPEVLDCLSELLASSLLVTSDEHDEPRLRMLETIRVYAAEKLTGADRLETEARHSRWMLALTASRLETSASDHRRWFDSFDHERANLRAVVTRALRAGELASVARIARDSFAYMAHRDAEAEVVDWLDRALALAHASGVSPAVYGRLLVVRALAATVFADFTMAARLLEQSRDRLPGDEDHAYDHALAAATDAYIALAQDPGRASALIHVAAERLEAAGDQLGRAYMEVIQGTLAIHRADLDTAARQYELGAQVAENLGDDAMLGRALSLLGMTHLARGNKDLARESVVAGARANRRGGQPTSMAYSLDGLAAVALADGLPTVAAGALAAAAALREQVGHPPAPVFLPLLADLVDRSRTALGKNDFAQVSSGARRWSVIEALDRTLAGLEAGTGQQVKQPAEGQANG
jgi:predicted ATPase/class 3 adenylate cyclase